MDDCEFSCPFDVDDIDSSDSLNQTWYIVFLIYFTVLMYVLHSLLKKYLVLVLIPVSFSIELVVIFEALLV